MRQSQVKSAIDQWDRLKELAKKAVEAVYPAEVDNHMLKILDIEIWPDDGPDTPDGECVRIKFADQKDELMCTNQNLFIPLDLLVCSQLAIAEWAKENGIGQIGKDKAGAYKMSKPEADKVKKTVHVEVDLVDWYVSDEDIMEKFGKLEDDNGLPYTAKDFGLPQSAWVDIDADKWKMAEEDGDEVDIIVEKLSEKYGFLIDGIAGWRAL